MYPDDFAQVAAVQGYEIPSVSRRGSAGNGYAGRAGVTKRISPHRLRHNLITAGLDAGVPLRDVQDAASHADPRTTTRTTGPAGNVLKIRPPLVFQTQHADLLLQALDEVLACIPDRG